MKKIFFLISIIFVFFLTFEKSNASMPIQFPITQLGNCANASECFSYCERAQNHAACWSYGKYVMYKQVLGDATTSAIQKSTLTFPITSLGNCANQQDCKTYCDNIEHRNPCTAFSKLMGLSRNIMSQVNPGKAKFLDDAKTILGCDGVEACSLFCSKSENHEKCILFSKDEGITTASGTLHPIPTGIPPTLFDVTQQELGCDSATTCKAVCAQKENIQKCFEFAIKHNLMPKPNISDFPKPSGLGIYPPESIISGTPTGRPPYPIACKTNSECETYCKAHPGVCPGFPASVTLTPSSTQTTGETHAIEDITQPQ